MSKYDKPLCTVLIALGLFILTGCSLQSSSPSASSNQATATAIAQLTVSAASSLQNPLAEIKRLYRSVQPGVEITFNFAASGDLQQQIEQGAPVDIFISAAAKQMDALQSKGLLLNQTRKDLCLNKVVLIAPLNSVTMKDFNSLTAKQVNKIAIGEPAAVPAGKYAQETLQTLNLWPRVAPKLVFTKNVRQVLSYVESGDADAGLVYFSDTKTSKQVKIIAEAPEAAHSPVIYPAAVVQATGQRQAAEQFLQFLAGKQAAAVFQKYGLTPLGS